MNLIRNKYIVRIAQAFVGFIFIYAAIEKIADPSAFADSISNYKLVPIFAINFFAIAIPWIELIVGILLVFNFYVKENALIFSTLMAIFTIMIFISVLRGLDISCGCFGTTGGQEVGILKILENLGLLVLGIYVFLFGDSSEPTTIIAAQNEN